MLKRQLCFASTLVIFCVGQSSQAGKYNDVLSIGGNAPAWTNLPGVEGKKHSLADLAEKKAIVVVFTCNTCPYAIDVEGRLNAFAKQIADAKQPVALVAINVNNVEADKMPAMKKKAEQAKFTFPYLYDETQKIARDFGATRTPEFFVLDERRRVVYMGTFDNSNEGKSAVKQYVQDAVAAALAGRKPAIEEMPPIGCGIRFDRARRKS